MRCSNVVALSALLLSSGASTRPAVAHTDGVRIGEGSFASSTQKSDTILLLTGAPIHPGVGTLIEDLSIGGSETVNEYRFTDVSYISPGLDGSVFIIDRVNPLGGGPTFVRKYDRNGKYLRSYGRQGQGPGEFIFSVGSVRELADGRVILADTRTVNVFSADGEYRTRWSFGMGGLELRPLLLGAGGLVYVASSKKPSGARPTDKLTAPVETVIRMRSDGTIIDTIAAPEHTPNPSKLPFNSYMTSVWSPLGYYVTAMTGSYAINLRIPALRGGTQASRWSEGDPVRSIRRTVAPVPLQGAERTDWRASTEANRRRAEPGWTWAGLDLPAVKPPITIIRIADDGRIWVQLAQPGRLNANKPATTVLGSGIRTGSAASRWPEPLVFDLLEPNGRYIGRLPIPAGMRVEAMVGDTVWGVVKDADDVPFVKRYHIRWGG